MFQETNSSSNNFASEAIKTIVQKNPVSDVFFSKANILHFLCVSAAASKAHFTKGPLPAPKTIIVLIIE